MGDKLEKSDSSAFTELSTGKAQATETSLTILSKAGHAKSTHQLAQLHMQEKHPLAPHSKDINTNEVSDAFELGCLYEDLGDFAKSEKHFHVAVDLKHPRAFYRLGLLYKNQYKRHDEALVFFRSGLKNGDSNCAFSLGELYDHHYGFADEALKHYLIAQKAGHVEAMFCAGNMYEQNYDDIDRAIYFYRKAASLDHMDAAFNLGLLYDLKLNRHMCAATFYSKAANLGKVDAMLNLGMMSLIRWDDKVKAEKYLLMADSQLSDKAMNQLGKLYYVHFKNLSKAKYYWEKAVKLGNKNAAKHLSNIRLVSKQRKTH